MTRFSKTSELELFVIELPLHDYLLLLDFGGVKLAAGAINRAPIITDHSIEDRAQLKRGKGISFFGTLPMIGELKYYLPLYQARSLVYFWSRSFEAMIESLGSDYHHAHQCANPAYNKILDLPIAPSRIHVLLCSSSVAGCEYI